MGLLSKIWKGIKNTAKKIAKGVRKTFQKIGKVFGKLGVAGQIGMMFLMPYAAGALGSFFGGAGKLANWSTQLLSKSGIGAKAIGHGLNMINKAGTFVGNVYSTVSETIGNAIDRVTNFAKGKGFKLSEAVVTPESVQSTIPLDSTGEVNFNEYFKKSLEDAEGFGTADFKVTDVGVEVTDSLLKPKSVVDTIKDIPSDVLEGIKDFDVQEAVSTGLQSSVTGALKLTGTQQLSKAFGYETPEGPSSYFIDIPEMIDAGVASPSVFNDVDFSTQKQGNNYLVSNVQNSRFLNNLVNSDSAYDAYMANFAASQFTPMQRALGMGV